ncbi:MAG: putative NADPH:quinone oxidoreductase-like [Terrestrivirus sp.]|uniref:Putative NADPH:quinone oxidoreductase-like n=1 Tax=Terrestrivirus sp. TaxID=2487775 RepID=A0A3G4ZN01_9VIRU|nr:MAG: putative NADPH:quinone oxidoreductase-like [Terrestrivirus sp.]
MTVTVLAISGSLRKNSKNTSLIKKAIDISEGTDIEVYNYDIHDIPMFNEDLEENLPKSVVLLKEAVSMADCLLLVTPENNFMPSAPIKNCIDWLSRKKPVSPLQNKTIAIMSAGGMSGGGLAQDILRGAFKIMQKFINMEVIDETVHVKLFDGVKRFDDDGNLIDEKTIEDIERVLKSLSVSVNKKHTISNSN